VVLTETPKLLTAYQEAALVGARLVDACRDDDVLDALSDHKEVLELLFDLTAGIQKTMEAQADFIAKYRQASE